MLFLLFIKIVVIVQGAKLFVCVVTYQSIFSCAFDFVKTRNTQSVFICFIFDVELAEKQQKLNSLLFGCYNFFCKYCIMQ